MAADPARPGAIAAAVRLTRRGIRPTPARTLQHGLEVVDEQRADVDGDGDLDALLMVDVAPSAEGPKPDDGRGVVVAYRERGGWRGHTVASVPVFPMEAGYNWGHVETLRAGEAPLLHVMFSQAGPAGARQSDTVLRFERGALREVYANVVESVPGTGEGAVVRSLAVQAADVDGDGTRELVERIASSQGCGGAACATPDGVITTSIARRVLRWDAGRGEFVDAPHLRAQQREATRALDDALAHWRAGDLSGRDAGVARAYAVDPLDARVRLAYARMLLREGQHASALDTLDFPWPAGFGRDARLLQAEAAARSGSGACSQYLAALGADDPTRRDAVAARLAALSPTCRARPEK